MSFGSTNGGNVDGGGALIVTGSLGIVPNGVAAIAWGYYDNQFGVPTGITDAANNVWPVSPIATWIWSTTRTFFVYALANIAGNNAYAAVMHFSAAAIGNFQVATFPGRQTSQASLVTDIQHFTDGGLFTAHPGATAAAALNDDILVGACSSGASDTFIQGGSLTIPLNGIVAAPGAGYAPTMFEYKNAVAAGPFNGPFNTNNASIGNSFTLSLAAAAAPAVPALLGQILT